jgi:hypothetical protein
VIALTLTYRKLRLDLTCDVRVVPFSAGDRRQLQGRETTLRTTSKINAVGSHRAIAPNDQRDPCGRLPGTAAPIPDTRGEER